MSQDCIIHNNDLVLYVSVLVVLILLLPLLDLIILRVTWFYRDDLFLPRSAEIGAAHKLSVRRRDSYFSSSYSTPSRTVHPLARTQATIIFANEDSSEEQRRKEDTIVYGKPSAVSGERTETFPSSRSSAAEWQSPKFRFAERHPAAQVDPLPAIESPSLRELSARRRAERSLAADTTGETFVNIAAERIQPKLTRVAPVSLRPALLPPLPRVRTSHQSSEFLERLADSSMLYQDNYDVAYVHSRTELIVTSTRESPQQRDKLLSRPDNVRRKLSKLDSQQPNSPRPK